MYKRRGHRSGALSKLSEWLDEQKVAIAPILARKERARQLRPDVPAAWLFVGVCGVAWEGGLFDIKPGFLSLRSVTNAPDIMEVCAAADFQKTDYLSVGRYSAGIRAELVVGNPSVDEEYNSPHFLHTLAWHIAALLKLRGYSALVCPVSATISWDTIAAAPDHSVCFRMLDDVPRFVSLSNEKTTVSPEDLEWVSQNLDAASNLIGRSVSRRFDLAFNLAYTWNHTSDARVAIVNLWCALEALFGCKEDRPVTQRLVRRIADWLPGSSAEDIKRLYDHRCDAVHGRFLDQESFEYTLGRSLSCLRASITKCIEEEKLPLPDWTPRDSLGSSPTS